MESKRIHQLEKDRLIGLLGSNPYPTCESCLLGKMTKSAFTGDPEKTAQVPDLVHTDIYEPIDEMASGGFHYFITFIDDHSRYRFVSLMKTKSIALNKFLKV